MKWIELIGSGIAAGVQTMDITSLKAQSERDEVTAVEHDRE